MLLLRIIFIIMQHTEAFVEEMKGVLLEEKERIEKSLEKIGHRTGRGDDFDANFPDYGDDEDENAMEVAEYGSSLTLEKELEKALRDIKNALQRIEDGGYGIDKYTGELISEDRLRARPTSTSSVASKKTLTQEL
jgi:RNA polymerase-binding transcription factor DksA